MTARLRDLPTDILAGGDRATQRAMIDTWLAARPASDCWAVLTGSGWLDQESVPARGRAGVVIRRLPPGCACCIGNISFKVALSRLLREVRPDHLIIILAPNDHLDQVLAMLRGEYWREVLRMARVAQLSAVQG